MKRVALADFTVNHRILRAVFALGPAGPGRLEGRQATLSRVEFPPAPGHAVWDLSLTCEPQAEGRRVWLRCPHWRRDAGRLYGFGAGYGLLFCCQRCAGLSYPGQRGVGSRRG